MQIPRNVRPVLHRFPVALFGFGQIAGAMVDGAEIDPGRTTAGIEAGDPFEMSRGQFEIAAQIMGGGDSIVDVGVEFVERTEDALIREFREESQTAAEKKKDDTKAAASAEEARKDA